MSTALVVGSVALLMLGLRPILLGERVAKEIITLEGVGLVDMGEIIALGLGVVLGDALLTLLLSGQRRLARKAMREEGA
jgi:hypothetical protein